ncbi:hypothetical protein V5799_015339 [Amblyomma americanum]|uniref:Uncharacterized protein n=1 Tax=Amblyomma americanum TaxID=6943 RepID=A0AAQ4E0F7_AMBAM
MKAIDFWLDILKEFPHWKQVLKRDKLCFSVTSSINYARNSVDKIDFVRPVRNKEDLQRYSRLRFITKGKNGKYPVEEKETTYYFDSTTRTHYWRYMSGNTLLRFFAYDTGDTLHYKVTQMLNAYGDDKCVVFDDLGEDSESANITVSGRRLAFGKFELLHGVHSALQNRYGVPFPG